MMITVRLFQVNWSLFRAQLAELVSVGRKFYTSLPKCRQRHTFRKYYFNKFKHYLVCLRTVRLMWGPQGT